MTWKDITIRKYIALSNAMATKYEDNEQMTFAILSVLYDKSTEYFESSIPITELTKHIKDMQFIYTKETAPGFPTKIRLGLKRYKIEHNVSELTSGQYIDLSTYCKDQETINKNYHKIIAVLVCPIGLFGNKFKRKIKNAKTQAELEMVHLKIWKERQELSEILLDELTMDKVFQISNYFFLLYQNLIKSIPSYLENKQRKSMENLRQVLTEVGLQNIGDGLLH